MKSNLTLRLESSAFALLVGALFLGVPAVLRLLGLG